MKIKQLFALVAASVMSSTVMAADLPKGTADDPLRVMMVPADTGGADITEDYKPVFDAIAKQYGVHFKVMSGESYAAVVKGLCSNQIDVAWYGPVTFKQAHDMCGAELLAVDVKHGDSVYYSGIFSKKDNGVNELKDLKGRNLSVGSTSSTSSFNFPIAMIIDAGIDPVNDIKKVVITGSHTNSIAALKEGHTDAAAASFNSWEKAVNQGIIDPQSFRVLAKSEPIPNPPLAMSKDLPAEMKSKLKAAFSDIHNHVDAELIRGYGGEKVDRYDANYPLEKMLGALSKLAKVTDELKAELVEKAGNK
ncbi:MAG: phosphate/phosphite/phosphonate ABC transporter substrate-binding protein [Methylophaga sp.]